MCIKILVVDDEPDVESLVQQRFMKQIIAGTYLFEFANSGHQAIALMEASNDFDVLLLDIKMTDMSGLTLLNHVAERLPHSRAVMVSAYGDMDNIRTAMNRGAFDFVTKPINFQDLELTINKTAQYVGQLRESIRVKAVADLKARFFDNITHEFRTPLSLILAPVDVLLEQEVIGEPGRQQLMMVRRNANQLLTLVNQLLDLTRLEADSLPILESPGDLALLVNRVTEAFYPGAVQKEVTLTVETSAPTLPGRFDADKWEKILANLLTNALKFTPAGGRVQVSLNVVATIAHLTVQDTGIGIASEHLPHIFDRFYQVDSSLTRAYEGSGIGLALVNELVGRLGGQITVESRYAMEPFGSQTGTTFRIELPIVLLDGPLTTPEQASYTDRDPVLPGTIPDMPFFVDAATDADTDQPLVLLVEDNQDLLTFMVGALTGQYRVLTAMNGLIGLEVARRELPDLIVSDLMMPVMDGNTLTRQLRADPTTDHIPIVLLTAHADRDHRLEGLSAGADDYLAKPFDLSELHLRLRNQIRRQQALRTHYTWQLGSAGSAPTTPGEPTGQDLFLQKIRHTIEANLDDSTFRAESLADAASMSVRTLTRKLCTIAGESPARLIRTYRLQRATDFLRSGHPVSETAYLVGFEHPANFATAFRDLFGQTPTDFINANRATER